MKLAPTYDGSENIRVLAIIIPELKLRDVQQLVFFADFEERVDNAAPKN